MSITIEKPVLSHTPFELAPPAPVFADPAALGLGAFALTTFLLSLANSGLLPAAGAAVLGIALFYGGIAQVAAGLWEFAKGNTFGATAFVSYGAFWLSFWWLERNPAVAKEAGALGVGAFLLAWTIFTALMTIAAIKTNGALLAVFVVLTLTFVSLTIGTFSGQVAFTHLAGWLGLLTAVLAWYSSSAVVINATWKRSVLPVWPSR